MTLRITLHARQILPVLMALAVLLPGHLRAQVSTTGGSVITTAVPFLMISPDSRGAGMADAGVAIARDANALYWNTAALAFTENKMGVALNYTPWLRNIIPGINHFFVPGYYNLGEKAGVIGASLTYFSLGEIQFTDNQGISTGNYNANEFAFALSYARKVTDRLSVGVNIKYISSNLAGSQQLGGVSYQPGESVAGDLSLFYVKPLTGAVLKEFSWGIHIQNMGAKMNYSRDLNNRDFLPTNLKIGAAVKMALDETNKLTLTMDLNKLMVPSDSAGRASKSVLGGMFSSFGDAPGGFSEELKEISISTGAEYWYNDLFAGRIGYFYESPAKGGRQYVSLGVGFKYENLNIDFAFLQPLKQNNPLQNTLRFSIGYNIGQ